MSRNVHARIALENAIVRALVEEAAKEGLVPVTMWNGEEYAPQGVRYRDAETLVPIEALTPEVVVEQFRSVDESTVHFGVKADLGKADCWGAIGVFLVGGNGEDVISDYHDRADLDRAIKRVYARIEAGIAI